MNLGNSMQYLDVGLGVALFAGIAWWMYMLTSKSHARRRLERAVSKTAARQPWDNDKVGRRGNR